MADREKVIDGLNETISYLRLKTGGVVDRCIQHQYDALELLKEQKPAKAKTMGESKSYGSWWFACGACGHAIDVEDNYCRECGRAVKWDE